MILYLVGNKQDCVIDAENTFSILFCLLYLTQCSSFDGIAILFFKWMPFYLNTEKNITNSIIITIESVFSSSIFTELF